MSHPNKTRIRATEDRGIPASETLRKVTPGDPAWKAALEQLRADGLLEVDEAPAYTPTDGAPSHPCEVCGEQARRTWTGGWDRVCSTECDRQQRAEAGSAEAETGKDAQEEDEMAAAKKTATCTECGETFESTNRRQICSEECKAARTRRYSREHEARKRAKRAPKGKGRGSRSRKPETKGTSPAADAAPDQTQTRTVEAELEEARQTIETLEQNCRSLEAKVQAELERADKATQQLETERRNASIIVDMQTAQEVVAERDALRAELKRAEDRIKEHTATYPLNDDPYTQVKPRAWSNVPSDAPDGIYTVESGPNAALSKEEAEKALDALKRGVLLPGVRYAGLDMRREEPLTYAQATSWRETLRELFDLGAISKAGLAQQLLEVTRRETGVELSIELGEVA